MSYKQIEAGKVGGEPADVEDSDDPMLEGEEEGDLLLGGGTAARDEDDFFLQGNHFACFGERTF